MACIAHFQQVPLTHLAPAVMSTSTEQELKQLLQQLPKNQAAIIKQQFPNSLSKEVSATGQPTCLLSTISTVRSAFFGHHTHQLLAASCLQHQPLPCCDTTKLLDQLHVPVQMLVSPVRISDQKAVTLVHYLFCVSNTCHQLLLACCCSTGSKYPL